MGVGRAGAVTLIAVGLGSLLGCASRSGSPAAASRSSAERLAPTPEAAALDLDRGDSKFDSCLADGSYTFKAVSDGRVTTTTARVGQHWIVTFAHSSAHFSTQTRYQISHRPGGFCVSGVLHGDTQPVRPSAVPTTPGPYTASATSAPPS